MKNIPKNVSNTGEDGDGGIGRDGNERLEGWGPPSLSGVDNGKLISTRGDITSSNVSRNKEAEPIRRAVVLNPLLWVCFGQLSPEIGCRQ